MKSVISPPTSVGPGLSTRHDDMLGAAQASAGISALTSEAYRDTTFIMPFFRHDQNDTLSLTFQFSHRRNLGSPLDSIHIHYIPMVNPAAIENVYFSYSYSWKKANEEFPALVSWVSSNVTMPIQTTDAFKHLYYNLVTNIAAPAVESYSSVLLFRITRLGTDGLDTYDTDKATPPGTGAANLGLLYFDCHYITDRRGSVNETTD
jgi:hypothetical protein